MNRKILVFFVVLLFSLSMVWAENNTTDTVNEEDDGNYILPISISDGEIKFNDGFAGFCIDSDKNKIETTDKFLLDEFNETNVENTIKLIIIEAYKQGKENEIGKIIEKFSSGDSSDDVIKEALSSNEKIGNNPVVKINNTTEATFNFEYLKSADGEKSDCIAYKVSMKTVEEPEILTAPNEDTGDDLKENPTQDKTNDGKNQNDTADNQTDTGTQNQNTKDASDNQNKTKDNDETIVNETNRTIVNKTNTVIVNENNTTVINNNNVKTVNNTNDTPKNDTTSQLLKAAGNPIFILIIVIVIIAIVAVAVRRKD